MRRNLVILALAAALAGASDARAADAFARGIDPVVQKPAATSDAFLTVEGARTRPAGSFHLSLLADYGDGLLGLRLGDEPVGELLPERLDLHLIGGYAILPWLELAADVPFAVHQGEDFARLEEETGLAEPAPAGGGLGDARLLAKARILDERDFPVALAIVGELRAPTGAEDDFLGGNGWLFAPRLAVERTFVERLRVAFEAGYRMRSEAGRYLNLFVGDELTFGLAGAYALPQGFALLGELLTATPARAPFNSPDGDALKTGLEALLGVRKELGAGFSAQLAGGTGPFGDAGLGRESFRVLAQVRFERVVPDRDRDGIPDDEDRCPDDPEDRDGFEDGDGCPDPDNDADGVPDVEDRCPLEPGPKEYDGCPDTDGDEIPDREDACPEAKGPAKYDGCPAGDPLALYEHEKIDIRGAINFDTGRATIQRDSFAVLDQVVDVMKAHPELRKVRVDGHTDSVGAEGFNQKLSARRARAVLEYLVAKGVEPDRLEAEGFGESLPVADNVTALGRAKNRRVEFSVVEIAR